MITESQDEVAHDGYAERFASGVAYHHDRNHTLPLSASLSSAKQSAGLSGEVASERAEHPFPPLREPHYRLRLSSSAMAGMPSAWPDVHDSSGRLSSAISLLPPSPSPTIAPGARPGPRGRSSEAP